MPVAADIAAPRQPRLLEATNGDGHRFYVLYLFPDYNVRMPRIARASAGGICYHVINRGNGGQAVFHEDADYDAFLKAIAHACVEVPMRVLGYCLMPNHFHLVVWPENDGDLSRWMHWVLNAHVRRYHQQYRRPKDWLSWVNEPITQSELEALRRSVQRGTPYGSPAWTAKTATRLGLTATLRPRGRPRKLHKQ